MLHIVYCTVLFQVYIGNPGEFPFLRNRAVQADMFDESLY